MKKQLSIIALVCGLAATPVALSHLDSTAFVLSYRQSQFAILGGTFGPMSSMIKGEIPWNDEQFKGWANDLATASKLDFMRSFPPGSEGGRTRAKPGIWNNLEDFQAKLNDFKTEAPKMAEVAAGGDKKAILQQFQKTGGTCKACHDEYKSKDYLNP